MNKNDISKIIQESTDEILKKNSSILEGQLDKTIEIAVQLSTATTLTVLQKLGFIEDFKD